MTRTFAEVKRGLEFDQGILDEWVKKIAEPKESDITFLMAGVPANPDGTFMQPEELVPQLGAMSLEDVYRAPDAACDTDMVISMETMKLKFSFPPGGVPRPKPVIVGAKKKRKSKSKRDKKGHGKRHPGDPPKSESMSFAAFNK